MSNVTLSGVQKAAILMLALGPENCGVFFKEMHDGEVKDISVAMSQLGRLSAEAVESVCEEFSKALQGNETFVGNADITENMLSKFLPSSRVAQIMDEIRGPSGRTIWEKIAHVPDVTLANYLKSEHPQAVAIILSKINPGQAARIVSLLPQKVATNVIMRILKTEGIQKDAIQKVEDTLRTEFVTTTSAGSMKDSHACVAEIFNRMERRVETRLMTDLRDESEVDAERVKTLMFTFDDVVRLPQDAMMAIVARVDKAILPMALKGTTDEIKTKFFKCMSERSVRMLRDDMDALGSVRMKDVDNAQDEVVQIAKDLIDDGQIEIPDFSSAEEMIS